MAISNRERPQYYLSRLVLILILVAVSWTAGIQSQSLLSCGSGNSISTPLPPPTQCMDIQIDDDINNRFTPTLEEEPERCLIYVKPSQYIDLVMSTVVGLPSHNSCGKHCKTHVPYDAKKRKFGEDWPPFGFTMIGQQRLENFRAAILEVNRNKIDGAIVELGVWRGGALIMAAAVTKESGLSRDIWVVDAFEDIPPEMYGQSASFLRNTEAGVRANFDAFHVNDPERVHFLRGMFNNTTPILDQTVGPIAVLRVDGNFYQSYQDVMYNLYEKVPVGGIVIFDDIFSHAVVLQFWDDFKQDHGLTEEFNRIDRHSGWFRKTKDVALDRSKMRPDDYIIKIKGKGKSKSKAVNATK